MGDKTVFAATLKSLRVSKGLTQKQLADELGISKSSIVSYENGLRVPSLDALAAIEDYFGVNSSYLQNGSHLRSREPMLSISSECVEDVASSNDYRKMLQTLDEQLTNSTPEIRNNFVSILQPLCGGFEKLDSSSRVIYTSLLAQIVEETSRFMKLSTSNEIPKLKTDLDKNRAQMLLQISDALSDAQNKILNHTQL